MSPRYAASQRRAARSLRTIWDSRPRADFRDHRAPALDDRLPAFVLKIGRYPLHHGALAVMRSLSHAGVRVIAVVEDRFTPAALSRHVSERVVWPTTGSEPSEQLVDRLVAIGAVQPTRPLLVCTDDVAAVLTAEGRDRLRSSFVMPDVRHDLPRSLSNKRGLHDLCRRHGVATPTTFFPVSAGELQECVDELGFPLVLKNVDPFGRLARPHVRWTTCVADADELRAAARDWQEPYDLLVQRYLPSEYCQDWAVNGYCGGDPSSTVVFTGRKIEASGPFAHATALGMLVADEELASTVARFCAAVGYRGVFETDWRQDLREGTFNLVDFNPRVGANFRLGENDAGVDVVRAMHLDLSGRPLPAGRLCEGDRLLVENLMLAARLSSGWSPSGAHPSALVGSASGRPRGAWTTMDDPLPALAVAARQSTWSVRGAATRLADRLSGRQR